MFAFNHFYCRLGVSHFILNSEKWTEDVLQALLFLECALRGTDWGNTYLSKAGACVCKHITNASHSDTKRIRGNERQGSESGLLPWHGASLVLLTGLQMNWETYAEPLRSSFLTLHLEYHPSLFPPFPFTPPSLLYSLSFVFELAYVFHMWNITCVKNNSYSGHNVSRYGGSTIRARPEGWLGQRALSTKPDHLRLTPRTHTVGGGSGLLQADLWPPQVQVTSIMLSHTIKKIIFQGFYTHHCII